MNARELEAVLGRKPRTISDMSMDEIVNSTRPVVPMTSDEVRAQINFFTSTKK